MEAPAVSCTVKPAVYLNIGAEAAARSGVCVLDVNLPMGRTVDVSGRGGSWFLHWSRFTACVCFRSRGSSSRTTTPPT